MAKNTSGNAESMSNDVIIIGGGLVGLTAAIALAEQNYKVAVVDRAPMGDLTAESYDGRASALAFATCRMFETLGLWDKLEPYAQPINEIRVSDGPSLMHLHFDHKALGDGPLGHMVENRHTRIALFERALELPLVTLLMGEGVEEIETDDQHTSVTLSSGKTVGASLLVGADGRMSSVRKHMGISVSTFEYAQHGIVCSVEHEIPHDGIAHERFLASGPFAVLPLTNNRSSLVWTEKSHLSETIMGLNERAFAAEIQRRIGGFLGSVKPVGGRWAFPLTLQYADTYIGSRSVIVGDAAHGIHPIAGQGLNLGLRDVAALVETIVEFGASGLDIGSLTCLERYSQWRHADNAALISVTDLLNRLFSNDITPVRHARDLGLAVVNRIPLLKNFFMSHARGTVGELPKLLRGEPLSY